MSMGIVSKTMIYCMSRTFDGKVSNNDSCIAWAELMMKQSIADCMRPTW